jgi:hypothetical protein
VTEAVTWAAADLDLVPVFVVEQRIGQLTMS